MNFDPLKKIQGILLVKFEHVHAVKEYLKFNKNETKSPSKSQRINEHSQKTVSMDLMTTYKLLHGVFHKLYLRPLQDY